MTPEGKVKRKVTTLLKAQGVYYFFTQSGGFGKSGVPDIIACIRGRFLAIECKAGDNQPTPLQQAQMKAISKAGGVAMVINEDKLQELISMVQYLKNGC